MDNIKELINDICNPPFVPHGHTEDGVIKDVVVLCDLIGVKYTPIGVPIYTFMLPNGGSFELDDFEFKTMIARYKELMEAKV